ncbi:MAG: flagellar hook-length control protein FliK, partial [Alphaproteobacteria bacterium]|nr:flagellar hook-length control protein FliK [Alphaproteobacteria bacterium]
SQATLAALGNQNSVSVLLASVLKLGDRARELPDAVQRAIVRLSAAVLPLDGEGPDAQALQRAIVRSGAFLESRLGAGAGNAAVEGDLKAVLLTLRQVLGFWLGPEARPLVLAGKSPPPPQPGVAPRAPAPAPSPDAVDDRPITDIGKTLLSQTDAALSRLRLGQIASLPDRPDAAPAAHKDVHLDLPVTLGQQPGVLSLVISRDDEGDTPDRRNPAWRVQFSINASVIGEVGAEVGLLGGRTIVVLSAAEPETVEALTAGLGELADGLAAGGLMPGALRVRRLGAPPPSAFPAATQKPSSHYLDRDT